MSPQIPEKMKAAVVYEPGPPEVFKIEERPVPKPKDGEVLIKVMAAGMNRSEMFTRQGESHAQWDCPYELPWILTNDT